MQQEMIYGKSFAELNVAYMILCLNVNSLFHTDYFLQFSKLEY